MDELYPGILMGGNAVIRRTVLERAGATDGTQPNRLTLLGCETRLMYHRRWPARGTHVPTSSITTFPLHV
jgi:hypothetical protein